MCDPETLQKNITIVRQNENFCRGLGPLPPMNPLALCMHACIKKEGRLENKKFFELKNEGYRDGIKRKETR